MKNYDILCNLEFLAYECLVQNRIGVGWKQQRLNIGLVDEFFSRKRCIINL